MKHTVTWVVTFDGAEARAYAWERAARKLVAVDIGIKKGERRPAHTDRPVRTYASASSARGAGDPKTDPERDLEETFIKSVVTALAERAAAPAFHHLIIAAPPRALGAFRTLAPEALRAKIQTEIRHDYVHTTPAALLDRLTEHVVP
jgi:protein required for attachment to host cells